MPKKWFIHARQFPENNPVHPFENFPFLVLARNTIILQRLNIHFSLYYLSGAFAYGRLKTEENFKPLALKVIVVAYEKWLLTRGSKYSDLTGKRLVFWKTGRLREVVATRGSTVILYHTPYPDHEEMHS